MKIRKKVSWPYAPGRESAGEKLGKEREKDKAGRSVKDPQDGMGNVAFLNQMVREGLHGKGNLRAEA